MQSLKCVVVGDGCIGKSYMIEHFITGSCPQRYFGAQLIEPRVKNVEYNGETITLFVCDMPGQEDYSRMRTLFYPDTSVFLICFSLVCRNSFKNVAEVWIPEVRRALPNAPIVIVGTKLDLRGDKEVILKLMESGETPVTRKDGTDFKNQVEAAAYMECSSMNFEDVKDVFDTAVQVAMKSKYIVIAEVEKKCCIIS